MSLFNELKRRNVFRVGIAYVLLGWIVLQAVDFALDLIDAPNWIIQVFFIAGLAGLPVALFFAWAFELTPEGIKRESEVDRSQSITPTTGRKLDRTIIAFLALAVVLLLFDRFRAVDPVAPEPASATASSTADAPRATAEAPGTETGPSIAVLPFVDMSPEGDQAYFSDGIAEEILNVLVKTDRLKVAGRTSSFQFRGRNEDLRIIGEQLGVDHILEGSVRKAGNRVRITAQLVKAEDGFHLWSETYDRELDDIFAVQDEISRAITDALAVHLDLDGKELVEASTRNMQAYENYLAARALISARSDFDRARQLLAEATRLDPDFAPAWSSHAQVLALLYYYEPVDLNVVLDEAERMARRALELDPDLSSAHSVLGDIYRDRSDWLQARDHYETALALNPSDLEARSQYGQMWLRLGYPGNALEQLSVAVDLDPLSWVNQLVQATALYFLGRTEEAWAHLDRSVEVSGEYRDFQIRQAIRMNLSEGRVERARELMEILIGSRVMRQRDSAAGEHIRQFLALLDTPEAALEFLAQEYFGRYEGGAYALWEVDVFWAVELGDLDLAARIFEEGATLDSSNAFVDSSWVFWKGLDALEAHRPEMIKRFLRRTGAVAFWRATEFPPQCRPLGEDDFECDS